MGEFLAYGGVVAMSWQHFVLSGNCAKRRRLLIIWNIEPPWKSVLPIEFGRVCHQ